MKIKILYLMSALVLTLGCSQDSGLTEISEDTIMPAMQESYNPDIQEKRNGQSYPCD